MLIQPLLILICIISSLSRITQAPERAHEDHLELESEPDPATPLHPRGIPCQDQCYETYLREAHPDRTRDPHPRGSTPRAPSQETQS